MKKIINFIQEIYQTKKFIALHEPKFLGNEKKYLNECIDSTFVSSGGKFVDEFEEKIAKYTGAKYAITTNSGTSALHISLILADVDKDTMGLSPSSLRFFLKNNTTIKNKQCINNKTRKVIKACVPMHSYGHPCKIEKIKDICDEYHIVLIEDAAESLGSFYKKKHTGTFGQLGTFSFNGNKIITGGGGGCIITNEEILKKAKKYKINLIKRKKSLCKNSTSANEVILDFIKNYIKDDLANNIIVYLQPTSPFRHNKHVDLAINMFVKKKLRSILSVTENKNFYKSLKKSKDTLSPFFNNRYVTNNRQNLKKVYSPNGAIYIFYASDFVKKRKLIFTKSGYFFMNRVESIDIDDKEDYELAKFLSKKYLKIK